MRRFFFDVRSGSALTIDSTGEVFADVAAAGDAALEIIQSVVRDEKADAGTQSFAVRVRDQAERVLFEAAFTLHTPGSSS